VFSPGIWWLGCPGFSDVFVRREAAERLETARVVVGTGEVAEMRAQLVMAIVVIPFDGSVFNRVVHALNLTVRPRVVWLGQAMLNAICSTNHVKPHGPGIGCVPAAGLLTKLDPIVHWLSGLCAAMS